MKLIACIKKDIKLICGNGPKGILLLVLPIGLFFLLSFFMRGMVIVSITASIISISVVHKRLIRRRLRLCCLFMITV